VTHFGKEGGPSMLDSPNSGLTGAPGTTSVPGATGCGCLRCQEDRRQSLSQVELWRTFAGQDVHFRYACEVCGNKRCPHHSDHRLACSGSNESGQLGSIYR
jgi:hypothetical protein